MSNESEEKMNDATFIALVDQIKRTCDKSYNEFDKFIDEILNAVTDMDADIMDPSTFKLLVLGIKTRANSLQGMIEGYRNSINNDIRKLKIDRGF